MQEDYDVVIIGAGPSGAACALALHGSGLRVAIVDKESFPRDKVCGDAIPSGAFKAMHRINPVWEKAMQQFTDKMDIRSCSVMGSNNKRISIDWILYSYNSKRQNFDDFLFQLVRSETGTTVIETKRLQQVEISPDGAYCHFQDGSSLRSAIVIGCDGANSVVKRQLDKSALQDTDTCAAVRAYFEGVEGIQANCNEFYFSKDLFPGYFWIFPLDNGSANVGCGILQNVHRDKKPLNLRDTLTEIVTTYPEMAPRFRNAKRLTEIKGFSLPMGTQRRAVSGERFMLCGDAASLVDPLMGHGIDKAMWSGVLAAEHAVVCFKSDNFTADHMAVYDTLLYKKVGSQLAQSTRIVNVLIKFPRLINFFTWLGQNQRLTRWVVRVLKF